MMDVAITGGLIAISIGLVEIMKILISKISRKNGHKVDSSLSKTVEDISEVILLKDDDGRPRVYWPRNIVENQEKISESCAKTAQLLEKTIEAIERLENRVDHISMHFESSNHRVSNSGH